MNHKNEELESNSQYGKNFERWAQQAADRMEEDQIWNLFNLDIVSKYPKMEICECPKCKEILIAPPGHDPLKRGCFICGWGQE